MAIDMLRPAQGNDLSDTLSTSIGSSDLTIPVNSISLWSASGGKIIIDRGLSTQEIIYCTGVSGSSLVVQSGGRGCEGTSAQGHNVGATVESVPTAGDWNDLITSLQNALKKSDGTLDTSKVADLTTSQTLQSKTLGDSSGAAVVKTAGVSSAVNEVTITNAATGNNPQFAPTGGDTNIGLDMKMKGTGAFRRPTIVELPVGSSSSSLATGDGQAFFRVPEELNGMNLTAVAAAVYTAGTTGTLDIQIRNQTQSADMLTTKLTIDSTETDSSTAATAAVIDTANDDVATGDLIAIDIDAVQSTPAKGLVVSLRFELP